MVKFIPTYSYFLVALMNGIPLTMFVLLSSLWVHKNATDFNVLILYLAAVLQSVEAHNPRFLCSALAVTYCFFPQSEIVLSALCSLRG